MLAYQKVRQIEGLAHPSAYVPHALATGAHADADADARWLRDADADADAPWLRHHSRLLR